MTYTETKIALREGNAIARRTRGSLATLERNASRAIGHCYEGNVRAARVSIRAMRRACDRIDRNAERENYAGAIGWAFEFAHDRCAEAHLELGAHLFRMENAQ
jgi:hypothetical protein